MAFQIHQPGIHELMQELRTIIDEYSGNRVLIGEDDDVAYCGTGDDELHLVYNFPLMKVKRLTPEHVYANQVIRLGALPPGAWPCNTLGNHDVSRMWNRYGDGIHDAELARLHLGLLLTLKGTPFLYNGEEIGMTDLQLTDLAQIRDTAAISRSRILTEHLKWSPEEVLQAVTMMTRDRCRTPLQWSAAPNSGFSLPGVTPWLPVNPNYAQGVNVAAQEDDPDSLLNFYRRLLHLRRATPALIAGEYEALAPDEDVFAFKRQTVEQTVLVALNFSDEVQTLSFTEPFGRVLFSNTDRSVTDDRRDSVELAPFEVFIAEMD